jgi:cell division protein FtsW
LTRAEHQALKERQKRARETEQKNLEAAKGRMDIPFLLLTLLLTAIGLVMVFSASFPSAYYESGDPAYYFKRQAIFAALGIVAMFVVSKFAYQRWRGAAKLLLGFSVFLLILVIIPHVGITVNNATRWLGKRGVFTFQPSEIAKLGVIVYFADSISKKKDKMLTWRQGIWPYMAILGIIAVLMMLEPHLSGTILIVGTGVVMMIVGGIRAWLVGLGVGGGAAAVFAYVKLVEAGIITYGSSRIAMWHNPWIDELGDGYQMVQSLIAIGSGGLLGVGLGKSRQKFLYLPEEHNDCIFAIVCEELGLIGACVIMLIFALLIIRGFWIALHARDRFGSLLAVGVVTHIALQTFLNIAVVSGLVPATGISLPFFSYGGTALALQLFEMGIVLSVSRQIPAPKDG